MDKLQMAQEGRRIFGSKSNVWKDYKLIPSTKEDRCDTCGRPLPKGRMVYVVAGKEYCCESCMDEAKGWKNNEVKLLCPHCGHDVTKEKETQYGIICPKCHHDFWPSEAERKEA